ncbi:carbohydrate-binding module family 50 protein, partial [Aureobasidium melanogenum]
MRVTQVIATLAPIGLVAAGPLHGHSRHTHLHHLHNLHHRSLTNGTLSNSTTTETANSTIYADHISYETSTVNVAANYADGTDANSASSEVASSTVSSTTSQSETAFPTLSLTSDVSYASGSPSNSSLALNISTAIPSDASVSVVLAVAATTPTAVGALSQTVDTTTSISVDTVYNTVTVNGAVTTASASEKTVTVTDVVTNFVTATFSALTPFKAPAIKVAALSSGSSCAAIKTSIVYLPASQSPTLIAGGVSTSKVTASSSKATTVRYVSQSSSKSSSSSVKKSSTSSKKTSTSAVIPVTKLASTSTKKSSTSSKKTSSSSAKKASSTSSSKKVTSTSSSSKKASTSSVKTTSSSKKSSTMITMSSIIQHGATAKTIVTTSSIPALVSGSSYKASSSVKSSSSKAVASSSAKASSSSCATVAAPASTQTGIVSGCTKWYTAKSGDYCYVIASANGISTDTFMAWNPAVNAPSCNNIQVGYAYCVATCSSSSASTAAASSIATSPAASTATSATQTSTSGSSSSSTSSSSSSSTSVASTAYKMYTGNGTVAAGWPSQSQWLDFDTMFTANIPIMQQSCANNGWGANDSPTEIADIKAAITKVSASSGVDPRFILAIVMQESNGCVRVVTTSWSVANPGLMQDHAGSGTCNSGGVIQDPCPASEIEQMIVDGTEGTASGDGLVQCLKETDVTDVSMYYRAARIYNGGLGGYHADDLGTGCCTLCYASDVANRLTGWSSGVSGCTL